MLQKFILYISHLMKSELFNFNRTQVNRFRQIAHHQKTDLAKIDRFKTRDSRSQKSLSA